MVLSFVNFDDNDLNNINNKKYNIIIFFINNNINVFQKISKEKKGGKQK